MFQLQSSCWFQAKTAQTTIVDNLFFNGPRAGINLNDGFGGGNVIQGNTIFNQCRQSGDHGPINSWDRQLFWTDVRDGPEKPGWNPAYTDVSKNVIIAVGLVEQSKRDRPNRKRGMKLTRLCSHAPVTALLPVHVGQNYGGSQGFDNDDGKSQLVTEISPLL